MRVGRPQKIGEISYYGIHTYISRTYGQPKKCEHCGTEKAKKYEWANISKKYKRNIADWVRLCAKCHKAFDREDIINKRPKEMYAKMWETRRKNIYVR